MDVGVPEKFNTYRWDALKVEKKGCRKVEPSADSRVCRKVWSMADWMVERRAESSAWSAII